MFNRITLGVLFSMLLSGCAQSITPENIDSQTQLFPASTTLSDNVSVGLEVAYRQHYQFVILDEQLSGDLDLDSVHHMQYIHTQALSEAGFNEVYDYSFLHNFIIANGLTEKNIGVDPDSLQQLANIMGPFLVVRVDHYSERPDWQTYRLTAFDPLAGVVVFELSKEHLVQANPATEMIYPTWNEFLKWDRKIPSAVSGQYR
ncbi:hypothetical protein [Shewanella youngdeokensis]|uniref:DUF4823 domain-containing protein n=1 Tax=Shewanella youngdeokensis TaxID=2999068 RepID=A0ABZ0JWK8_9GAMM|nr:hypothetical protein RGE70_12500 [Shewanella sp. DAU334]